mmetsp:Transcript_71896/g.169241  ORF Transcript_71896/g.169241 Transcript_71896/m.169241 type:complete len:345 (-) Transcript_71896:78-1112(-)
MAATRRTSSRRRQPQQTLSIWWLRKDIPTRTGRSLVFMLAMKSTPSTSTALDCSSILSRVRPDRRSSSANERVPCVDCSRRRKSGENGRTLPQTAGRSPPLCPHLLSRKDRTRTTTLTSISPKSSLTTSLRLLPPPPPPLRARPVKRRLRLLLRRRGHRPHLPPRRLRPPSRCPAHSPLRRARALFQQRLMHRERNLLAAKCRRSSNPVLRWWRRPLHHRPHHRDRERRAGTDAGRWERLRRRRRTLDNLGTWSGTRRWFTRVRCIRATRRGALAGRIATSLCVAGGHCGGSSRRVMQGSPKTLWDWSTSRNALGRLTPRSERRTGSFSLVPISLIIWLPTQIG